MPATKYEDWVTPDNLLLLTAWARDDVDMKEIAKRIGISRKTLYEWKKDKSDISDALKKGKEIVDVDVENAVLKSCLGYIVRLKKTFKCKRVEYDQTTGKKILEQEELVEGEDEVYIAPVPLTQIYWLNNRKPEVWKNKPEPVGGDNGQGAAVVEIPARLPEEAPPEVKANGQS